jgi:hypothetical protein
MWDQVVSRIRRFRPSVYIVGVAVVVLGLGSVFVQQLIRVRDDRITEVGCGVVPDASVGRWLPGAKAQPEPVLATVDLRCRWRAADPRAHKSTVLLLVWLQRRASPKPLEDNPRELTAADAYGPLLYQNFDGTYGPVLEQGADIEAPLIGDEAISTLKRRPRAEEVTATVQFRRNNAVVQLHFKGHGVPDGTARGVAETLAREVVNRL